MRRRTTLVSLLVLAALASGCAKKEVPDPNDFLAQEECYNEETNEYECGDDEETQDPLEPWNRFVDKTNQEYIYPTGDFIVENTLRKTPQPVQKGVKNVAHNLSDCCSILPATLQFKFEKALDYTTSCFGNFVTSLWTSRFMQKYFGVPSHNPEDFNQVLAYWGAPPGPHITWPILGHSDVRGTIGLALDYTTNPFRVFVPDVSPTLNTLSATEKYNSTIELREDTQKAFLDLYTGERNAYREYTKKLIEE